jgi:hypothetical protein
MLQNFSKVKTYLKTKFILKNTIIDEKLTYASETRILTKTDKKQINILERKLYKRVFGPDMTIKNWGILIIKDIYAIVKKPIIKETIRLHRLC